ncbi:long-chain-fatty-acid--CoA ligase 4-like [Oppia nitens]|uniref:long-chain-fatty-acid--CoA ligase 4-like n=1 Tax=Oppia nitens TaxID=1686743 RepID=UPI0023DC5002|nr:long-chain-fatty-acid--CoA ligase 4-like [Oppia nitens]
MSHQRRLLVSVFILLVRLVVNLYTYTTLLYYYLTQKPWTRRRKAAKLRSILENPGDPNSAWVINEQTLSHPVMRPTVTEVLNVVVQYHGQHTPILGYREVLSCEDSIGRDGKVKRIDGRSLKKYKLSDYKWLTYGQVDVITTNLAKGLLSNGCSFGDKILILSETRVEWFLSAQAVAKLGGTVVTLFSNLGDEGIVYGINQTEVKVMIVSSDLMPKIRSLIARIPTVETIVYISHSFMSKDDIKLFTDGFPTNIRLQSLADIEAAGTTAQSVQFQAPRPEDPYIIMYTSGTTGTPKAAIATHRQMISGSANAILVLVKDMISDNRNHTYIAFLPLAHVLELTIEFFLFYGGVRIGYASPFTLTDSAPGLAAGQKCDIKLLKPTAMTTVPLVLDRILKEVHDKLNARTPVSVDFFKYIMSYKAQWVQRGYQCPIVNKLVCNKVQQQLGGRLHIMIVGGAPLNANTQAVIKSALDVILVQGYGATETMGAVLCMDFNDLSFGRVGAPLQGIKVKLIDWDEGGYHRSDKPNPRGEIVIGGDSVVTGYYQAPDQTEEAFRMDDSGVQWFYTGDIGEMFPDGTFKIIDRRKDLLKLQNGEYVSLGKIEALMKSCPYVDNICVCGGTYSNDLTALVSPNQKNLLKLCQEMGIRDAHIHDICANHEITKRVYQSIVSTGQSAGISKKEIPIRICLVPDEWTPDNDMLTAAMKMRRKNVEQKYRKEIDALFNDDIINNNNNISKIIKNSNNNNNDSNISNKNVNKNHIKLENRV